MQQREEAAAAKKQPTPTPKPPSKSAVAEPRAETKREPSAPKRPADAAEEAGPKPKRIKEGPSEPRGTTPLPASAAPRAASGPPLPAAELAELVAQLTRAMEAAPPDEEAIATVLAELESSGMTLELLRETGVGKTVNTLKKLVTPPLAGRARALVDQWKTLQSRKE